jgi:5-methyltetrahydrofolate--homocysteine methyltransferase
VVHVLDASRAVGVVGSLVSDGLRANFTAEHKREQDETRRQYLSRQTQVPLLPIGEARTRKLNFDWTKAKPAVPSFIGRRVLEDVPLKDVVPFIDWSPLFHTWELKGTYPAIFEDKTIGTKAKELFEDATRLLDRIVKDRLLRARGVYGFWPAASVGDDIEVYNEELRKITIGVFHTLRQQTRKAEGEPNIALADFIAPKSSGIADYIGAFAVTAGYGLPELCAKFEKEHDDYNSIMAKALADRLAEAFAEYLHKHVREQWGYGVAENLSNEDLIQERYRGIRPAPGYPASPDHSEKRTLFNLLEVEVNTGIGLTENFAMIPASSVCGLYLSHPAARYFSVGKIDRDQVQDYHARKGMNISEVERWLRPNLAYEPGT